MSQSLHLSIRIDPAKQGTYFTLPFQVPEGEVIFNAPTDGDVSLSYKMESPGFVRAEVLRTFLPGMPMLPALITNPIYFD